MIRCVKCDSLLRCIVSKRKDHFVGVCLELSVAAQGSTPEMCKNNLLSAISAYSETVDYCIKDGLEVELTPVKYYSVKRLFFDVRRKIASWRAAEPTGSLFSIAPPTNYRRHVPKSATQLMQENWHKTGDALRKAMGLIKEDS